MCPRRTSGLCFRPGQAVVLALGAILIVALPERAEGQMGLVVGGRVVDARSGAGLSNALLRLEGHGAVLSEERGTFRFEGVSPSRYSLRVEAFGYEDLVATIEVERDTVLTVALEILPIELDGLTVTLETVDFEGRVRDPRTDSWVLDAEVRSDQGHHESTNLYGGFGLDDVFDGPPLRLIIRAFRYLPLDTTFVPDDEERYPFDLSPDPVMSRMIEAYVDRLDERAGKRIYPYQPALNRQDLARFSPGRSLRAIMEAKYPLHIVRRIGCLFLDEHEYRFRSEGERISVMEGTVANDLERIELLEFPGEGRLIMARVYTRRFFQRRVGTSDKLDRPSMISTPVGFMCR